MLLIVTLAVAGLGLLAVAADQLVLGAGRLATRLGVSPVVVGVVVIGLGTSAPEFLVSGVAAARGDADLAVGNLVGSNIINVTLILGVAGLVAPVVVRSGVPRREAPLAVAGVVLLAAAALLGLGRVAGTVLAIAGAAALIMLVRLSRPPVGDPMPEEVDTFLDEPARRSRLGVEIARSVLGLLGTLGGAQLLVVNAAAGADRLGVPATVVGFTVVALGTSLPELVTAVQAQRRGEGDLLVGNLLGSNLFNSVAGGAIVGLVTWDAPVRVAYPAVAAMVVTSLAAWWVLYRKLRVSRAEAALLLVVYLLTLPLIG